MSQFADYERASNNYDNGRTAAGADIMAGMLCTHLDKNLKDIKALDAGCGTGNYSMALLKHGVGKMFMMDASEGMLSKAKAKVDSMGFSDRVEIKQANLPIIPYDDNTFDFVMINQVLHHIGKNPDGNNFPSFLETFKEVKRVLKPNGLFVITSMTKEQLSGVWYYCLNKEFLRRYSLKFPTVRAFKNLLREADFDVINFISVLGHDIVPNYTYLEGPLYKTHRDSESYWDVASEQELQETINFVLDMKENGKLRQFYEQHDKTDEQGYFVIILAKS